MSHRLHQITFDDGTSSVTLEPPAWEEMSYDWEPVAISSMFEAYSGAAQKQINVGATAKWNLTVSVTGCKAPATTGLDQSVTWEVTLINRDAIDSANTYTLWPSDFASQEVNPRTARRSWTSTFREA